MAETPEHAFLSERFLAILDQFSRLDLYGYREADRRRFDFACLLERSWSRPLVGQTVWEHGEGLDKDMRTLLTDPDVDIAALVLRSTARNEVRLAEVLRDYQRTPAIAQRLFRLKVFPIPPDFDADDPSQRGVIEDTLRRRVVSDILFGTVFGRLAARDVITFLNGVTGLYPGLALQILHLKETEGYVSPRMAAERAGTGAAAVRERLQMLHACGFTHGLVDELADKGRMFLALLDRTAAEHRRGSLSAELVYVLTLLGCRPVGHDSFAVPPSLPPEEAYNFEDLHSAYEGLLYIMLAASPLAARFDPGEAPPPWAPEKFAARWVSERRVAFEYFRPQATV